MEKCTRPHWILQRTPGKQKRPLIMEGGANGKGGPKVRGRTLIFLKTPLKKMRGRYFQEVKSKTGEKKKSKGVGVKWQKTARGVLFRERKGK